MFSLFYSWLFFIFSATSYSQWHLTPEHILVTVFQYIPQDIRSNVSLVCTTWRDAFTSPYLWNNVKLSIKHNKEYEKFIENYGSFISSIVIEVNQFDEQNRKQAKSLIDKLARIKRRRLVKFSLVFTGENPCLYGGQEFKVALATLFGPPPALEGYQTPSLKVLDLSRVQFTLEDDAINSLAKYNPDLESVNLQFKTIISRVSASSVLMLVDRCRSLRELCVYSDNFNIDIMLSFMDKGRVPLQHLYLTYRRELKFDKDIPSTTWKEFVDCLPGLKVTLMFDHTCPLVFISNVMKPDIPVNVLRLETYTYIYNEVRQATDQYKDTLVEFILRAPLSRNSTDLDSALVYMSINCKLIKLMKVYCDISRETADQILEALPVLRENKCYRLKYE